MQGGPVNQLLYVAVERPALDGNIQELIYRPTLHVSA